MNEHSSEYEPGMLWAGRPIEELSRDELLKALYKCAVLYKRAMESHQETLAAISYRSNTAS